MRVVQLGILAAALMMFIGVSAAQSTENLDVEPEPGLVKADGLLYPLDVGLDNVLMSVGVKSPGDVAFKRASEAAVAERRNNSEAFDTALAHFNGVAVEADNDDLDELEQAESVLSNVSSRVPDEASQGLDTALENVRDAKERVPEEFTSEGMDSSGLLPDVELPGSDRDSDLDVPGSEASSEGR